MKYSTEKSQAETNAHNYIMAVIDKQGSLPSLRDLYGDGTRFKGLDLKGFKRVYGIIQSDLLC